MEQLLFRVQKPFSITLDSDYDFASASVTDFKQGDVIKVNDDGNGNLTLPYSYQTSETNFFGKNIWKVIEMPVDRSNLVFVKVCSGYVRYSKFDNGEAECISPNVPLIDTSGNASGATAGDNKIVQWAKKPFGLHPVLGWGLIITGVVGAVWGISKAVKPKKK